MPGPSDQAAPVAGRRPRRARRIARVLSWVALVTSVVLVATSGLAYAYYRQLNGNVHRVAILGGLGQRPAQASDGAQNILLVGNDDRTGFTAAQLQAANTTFDGGGVNTDTLILMHLAPKGGPVTFVSFPRDSYVAIPGHGHGKINSAYQAGETDRKDGGPALLISTIEQLSGLHIDHLVMVKFFQFIDISNAVGGVQVCLTQPANDDHVNLHLSAGTHVIQGSTALSFVRQRYNLPGGDLDRIKRQQRFISALARKAKAERNPATINAVLQQATKSLTVDSGLSGTGLLQLAQRLQGIDLGHVQFDTVPVASVDATVAGVGSIVKLDEAKLALFFDNIAHERTPNAPAPPPPAVPVADVHVRVLNAAGTAGLAGTTRTALAGYGFTVDAIGDAPNGPTSIRYAPADAGAAATLTRAIPGAQLVPDDTRTAGQLVLLAGTDFAGVHDPSTSTAAPLPAPAASTPPPASSPQATAANQSCGV